MDDYYDTDIWATDDPYNDSSDFYDTSDVYMEEDRYDDPYSIEKTYISYYADDDEADEDIERMYRESFEKTAQEQTEAVREYTGTKKKYVTAFVDDFDRFREEEKLSE